MQCVERREYTGIEVDSYRSATTAVGHRAGGQNMEMKLKD